ncbi:HD domain-containing phosphohydrolase [Salinicola rhizosphaerae]|uniref:HD-GYP domain-containing protein n=1 Tax=Salinicola rhizosphaerae TaxID=1443141 RepID=A0ABQ3EAK3_9GAMM|nr:HD domain-containing phosphohydrolase [Salinicola rhizosphaerae]GHB28683.1 hypothetical protein GCM10009038_29490 [Salinicola rhizosphaerae]
MAESATTDISKANAKWEWLEPLCLHGSVNLAFAGAFGASWPVVLDDIERDEAIIIDITATPALTDRLEAGESFHLIGHVNGAMVRTSALTVQGRLDQAGRVRLRCSYPEMLSTVHRRGTFRAPIRSEMGVAAHFRLNADAADMPVELDNLSLGGCLLTLRLADAVRLTSDQPFEQLSLQFPNGQRLTLAGWVRHVRTDDEWTTARVGCEFAELPIDGERMLWHCVKEAERESARRVSQSATPLQPSTLFLTPEGKKPAPVALPARTPATVAGNTAARYLFKIADYLYAQILELQNGGEIASTLLSRHTDTLLRLAAQSRESLLFALAYLDTEPAPIRHGLGVAVRAADLARGQGHDTETLKAVTASALIHDLGKALLPSAILESASALDSAQRDQLVEHVAFIRQRLDNCRWLSPHIADQIIGEVNERLDGSGYPVGAGGDSIGDLGRMMAVVDVVEAMTRPRPDRAAWPLTEVYRHLLGHPEQFDTVWVQRYVKRFGTAPVGALARFSSGALAWVQRLDDRGRPRQVHLVLNVNSRQRRLDQLLMDGDIDQLGRLEGVVDPQAFGLSLAPARE